MNQDRLNSALKIAIEAAEEAGVKLLTYYGNIEAEVKGESGVEASDIVTRLDRETESFLCDRFKEFDPSIGFRGEEFGVENQQDTTWLVDPIDGTSHFVRGLPFCTTMIALIEDGIVVMSVIHDFVRKDTYWAIRGRGAYKNNERIFVSKRPLSQAVVSFETRIEKAANMDAYLRLKNSVGGIVSTINCGFEFAMVASGKLEARIARDPYGYDWDYAPGSLLVEEAGGIVRNLSSDGYDYRNHDFVAANPAVYEALSRTNLLTDKI